MTKASIQISKDIDLAIKRFNAAVAKEDRQLADQELGVIWGLSMALDIIRNC